MNKEEKQEVVKFEKEAFGRAKMKLREWQINQYTSAREGREEGRSLKYMPTHFSSSRGTDMRIY